METTAHEDRSLAASDEPEAPAEGHIVALAAGALALFAALITLTSALGLSDAIARSMMEHSALGLRRQGPYEDVFVRMGWAAAGAAFVITTSGAWLRRRMRWIAVVGLGACALVLLNAVRVVMSYADEFEAPPDAFLRPLFESIGAQMTLFEWTLGVFAATAATSALAYALLGRASRIPSIAAALGWLASLVLTLRFAMGSVLLTKQAWGVYVARTPEEISRYTMLGALALGCVAMIALSAVHAYRAGRTRGRPQHRANTGSSSR
jgi:hypothetical protein